MYSSIRTSSEWVDSEPVDLCLIHRTPPQSLVVTKTDVQWRGCVKTEISWFVYNVRRSTHHAELKCLNNRDALWMIMWLFFQCGWLVWANKTKLHITNWLRGKVTPISHQIPDNTEVTFMRYHHHENVPTLYIYIYICQLHCEESAYWGYSCNYGWPGSVNMLPYGLDWYRPDATNIGPIPGRFWHFLACL